MSRTEKPDPPIGEAFQRFSFSPTIDGESFRGAFPPIKKCEPRRKKFDPPSIILNLLQDLLEGPRGKDKRFRNKFGMTEK